MYTSWKLANSNGTYALQFGSIGDNYWRDGIYPRSLEFEVKDPTMLTEFTLASVYYDDYILIKINGTYLFSGPYGGTELSLFSNGKVNIGDGVQRNRELGTSWGRHQTSI